MTDLKKAAQQALEALESLYLTLPPESVLAKSLNLRITTLKAALAEPVQEPLSDEELDRLWREPMSADWEHREYARAIEAAHGIKENT